MAIDYGLPGVAALDNPYGLPPAAAVRTPEISYGLPRTPAMPVSPIVPMVRAIGAAISSGGAALRNTAQQMGSSVVPFSRGGAQPEPQKPAAGVRVAPLVGKDIPLNTLIDMQRRAESSGNYQALNRQKPGNTASGAYQYTDSTWNGYGGYAKAMLAPKAVQDRRFAEDISKRAARYNGDLFKSIAAHYLPAQADSPDLWTQPAKVKTKGGYVTVEPVAKYLQSVLKGTPYAKQLEAYLNGQ